MARLSLSLLGTLQATLDGEPIAGFESVKVRALLAYLAVEADRPHHRRSLAGLLWPDRPDRAARSNLRHALSVLRKTIADHQAPPPHLSVTRDTVQFNAASDCWTDVAAFSALVEADRRGHSAGRRPTSHLPGRDPRLSQLEEAVALYRGRFLEGLSVGDSPAFEDWALLLRERLQRQAASALQQLSQAYAARGDYVQACGYGRRWLALEPWQEEAHQQLMRLLALSGQRSAALAQYEACCRALAEELDVEPTAETTRLYKRIRDGEDLSGFGKPDRSPYGSPTQPPRQSNLPAQLTPLVGREALLDEVAARLADPACRLLALTGPGGSGKTRLALEAAGAQLEAHADGVYWVSLAPLGSSEAIVPTIAQAIGFTLCAPTSDASGAPRQQLLAYLRRKHMLLVLDNAEHLPAAAKLSTDILNAAPEVKLLVTSRARMNVPGEHLLPVRGMDVPPASLDRTGTASGDERRYSALQLFAQGARRVQPAFELDDDNLAPVIQICRAVGGLPLGILLAAAWTQMLSPAEIARELTSQGGKGLDLLATDWEEAPARQHSIRAVFDHSWRLLSEREREVIRALSVFRGGCTREAAQQVGDASLRELMALVRQSLLERTPAGRYEIHELLRQYAAEMLAASPDGGNAVRDRHAACYAAALERWAADSKGHRQLDALKTIEPEIDNARTAWEWAIGQERLEIVDRAMEGLCLLHEWRGYYEGGGAASHKLVDRLESLHGLSAPAEERTPCGTPALDAEPGARLRLLAHALAWQGRFGSLLGKAELVDRCFERSLAILDDLTLSERDAQRGRAFVLLLMAERAQPNDLRTARQLAERALAVYQGLGDRWGISKALLRVGAADWLQGAHGKARQQFEESLAFARQIGDRRGIAWALCGLGMSAKQFGQLEEAERTIRESMAIAKEADDVELVWATHGFLCDVLGDMGQFLQVRSLREQELARSRERGDRYREIEAMLHVGSANRHLGSYDEARALVQAALDMCQESGPQSRIGSYYRLLGRLALAQGAYPTAQEYMERSVSAYQSVGGGAHPIGETLGEVAYVARALGLAAQAQGYLCTLLHTAVQTQTRDSALLSVVAMALLLIDGGDVARALELYTLASRYAWVANSRWFEDVAGREIAAAAATLPPDVAAAAEERGRARDLWATVEELLAELEATAQDEESLG